MVRASIIIDLEYPNDVPMSILEELAEELREEVDYEIETKSSVSVNFG